MSGIYGFEEKDDDGVPPAIELPNVKKQRSKRRTIDKSSVEAAVESGEKQGFVDREPRKSITKRLKPGPKRTEPQTKITIHGPERVLEAFKAMTKDNDVTLWQQLEILMENYSSNQRE